jgi:hypothetical protein
MPVISAKEKGKRTTVQTGLGKNNLKAKRAGAWLKWQSAALSSKPSTAPPI